MTSTPHFHYDFALLPERLRGIRQSAGHPLDSLVFNLPNVVQLKRLPEPVDRIRDLAVLAYAVVWVDRLSRRPGGTLWSRALSVTLPVSDLSFWRSRETDSALCKALHFLTKDYWEFHYKAAPPQAASTIRQVDQSTLFDCPATDDVSVLHSGGLDALAAASDVLLNKKSSLLRLIGISTSDRVLGIQRKVASAIDQMYPHRTAQLSLDLPISKGPSLRGQHRARCFLFQVFGSIVARASDANELIQGENGISSLAVPSSFGSLPWQHAKGSHPRFQLEMSRFLSRVFESDFRIHNPLLFLTKAECCETIDQANLDHAIPGTASCNCFPQRVCHTSSCGVCGQCVLRRQSLFAAGLTGRDEGKHYRYDICQADQQIPKGKVREVRAMLWQIERLRHVLWESQAWSSILNLWPDFYDAAIASAQHYGIGASQAEDQFVTMLQRYVEEWADFPVKYRIADTYTSHDKRRIAKRDFIGSSLTLGEFADVA